MKKRLMGMLTFCSPCSCSVCVRMPGQSACCLLPSASVQVECLRCSACACMLLCVRAVDNSMCICNVFFCSVCFVCSVCFYCSVCFVCCLCALSALSALSARFSRFWSCTCAFVSSSIYSLQVTMVKIPVVTVNQLWLAKLS